MAQEFGIRINFDAVTAGLERGINEVKGSIGGMKDEIGNSFNGFEDKMKSIGSSMQKSGGMMTAGLTVPIGGFFKKAIDQGLEFESGLAVIAGLSEEAAEKIDKISDRAKHLGRTTAFSSAEAQQGMENLLRAGLGVDEAMLAVESSMKLATVAGVSLDEATGMMSTTMSVLGTDVERTEEILSSFARVASDFDATITDVQEVITRSGGAGVELGIDEETQAVLAGFMTERKGGEGKGNIAGTSLNTIYTDLMKVNEKQAASLEERGIHIFDNDGNVNDFMSIIEEIDKQAGGMSDIERNALLRPVFGKGLEDVMAMASESANIGELIVDVKGDVSFIDQAYEKITDTTAHKIKEVQSAFSGILDDVFVELEEPLNDILDTMLEVMEYISGLSPETKGLIVKGLAALAIIGPLLVGIGSIISAIGTIFGPIAGFIGNMFTGVGVGGWVAGLIKPIGAAIMSALGAVAAFLGISVGALVAFAAAIAGGLYLIWKFKDQIADFFKWLWKGIKSIASSIWNSGIVESIRGTIGDGIDWARNKWGDFTEWFGEKKDGLMDFVSGKWETFSAWLTKLKDLAVDIFLVIIGAGYLFYQWVEGMMSDLVEWIMEKWESLKGFFSSLWEGIVGIFEEYVLPIWDFLVETFTGIWEYLVGVWDDIKQVFMDAWEWIDGIIQEYVMPIWEFLVETFTGIWEYFIGLWDEIKQVFANAWEWIDGIIQEYVMPIWDFLVETFTGIWEYFIGIWDDIKKVFSDAWEWIDGIIQEYVMPIYDYIVEKFEAIKEFLFGLWDDVKEGTKNKWEDIKTAIGDAVSGAFSVVTGWYDRFKEAGSNIVGNMITGIKSRFTDFRDAGSELLSKIGDQTPNSPPKDKSSPLANLHKNGIVEQLVKGIYSQRGEVDKAFKDVMGYDDVEGNVRVGMYQSNASKSSSSAGNGLVGQQITLNLGDRSYEAFVDGISREQGRVIDLEEKYV